MDYSETIFEALADSGWVVLDDALAQDLPQRLHRHALNAWDTGRFHDARIGREHTRTVNAPIRGDSICWIEDADEDPASQALMSWARGLRLELNRRFFMALKSEEFHFARYAEGCGYRKHLDQHQTSLHRKISLILYLNQDWKPADGGELCLYSPDDAAHEVQRVLPLAGRLVMFRSDTIHHEVLPCRRTRWSVAGWLRTD